MNHTAYELVSSWLPEDRKQLVLLEMKKKMKVDGFRPGKAPVSKIINLLPRQASLQKGFLMEVFLNYFPVGSLKDIEMETLIEEESDERFPGVMAAYFLKNSDDLQQMPENLQAWIKRYEENYLPHPETPEESSAPTEEELPAIEDSLSAGPAESAETEAVSAALEESAPDENSGEETGPSGRTTEPSVETAIPGAEEQNPASEDSTASAESIHADYHSEHLGYVLKEGSGNSTFYNFYPAAKINPEGSFVPYPRMEAKFKYPKDGKINLSSRNWNYKNIQMRFKQGGIYILEIEDHFLQDNLNSKGDFYPVQNKIDIEDIDRFNFLHKPEEEAYQYYQVCSVRNLPKLLCEGKLILIQGPGAKRSLCEYVLLRDEETGWMVGPFQTKHQLAQRGDKEMSWFADPGTEGPQYIYDVYTIAAETDPMVEIYLENDPAHKDYLVKLPSLNKVRRDFITDEILLKEVQEILQKSGGEKPDFTQSLFCSPELPDSIIAERMRRMEQVFQRDISQHEIAERFSGTIADLLLRSLETDMESGSCEIVRKLAENKDFLRKIQNYRKFEETVEKKQQELQTVLNTCREKINLHTEKIAELEARKAEYQQNLLKFGLVDDISGLMEQKEALKADLEQISLEREKALQERNEIQTQAQQVISSLEETLKNPLKSAADVVVHRRLYDALYASMAPSAAADTPPESSSASENPAVLQPMSEGQLMGQLTESFHSYRPGFTDNDIINLYICLTQGFLTVFAGAPGTGKTSACRILAHSLGLDSDETPRFILVPVERGWGSKRDFIGYYNPLTKSFDRSNSQVYEALETSDAESERYGKEPVPPQIILLDEANLSQMEYYWSVFMNAADYSPRSALVDLGNGKTFRVSKALRFLATINNDNTTEGLSPRLIDRAWIISLPTGGDFREVDFTDVLSQVSMQELEHFFGRKAGAVTQADLDPVCGSILKAMYSLCQDLHWEVSERSKGAILQYCMTGCRRMFPEKTRIGAVIAADYAISQKILPRLQGHGTDYRDNILMRFKTFFHQYQLTKCEAAIDRILREGNENMNYYHFFSLGQA